MKPMNLITLLLVIIGGLNWGIFALADTDLIGSLFGPSSGLAKVVYLLVAASALWQLVPFARAMNDGEVAAESARRLP